MSCVDNTTIKSWDKTKTKMSVHNQDQDNGEPKSLKKLHHLLNWWISQSYTSTYKEVVTYTKIKIIV